MLRHDKQFDCLLVGLRAPDAARAAARMAIGWLSSHTSRAMEGTDQTCLVYTKHASQLLIVLPRFQLFYAGIYFYLNRCVLLPFKVIPVLILLKFPKFLSIWGRRRSIACGASITFCWSPPGHWWRTSCWTMKYWAPRRFEAPSRRHYWGTTGALLEHMPKQA